MRKLFVTAIVLGLFAVTPAAFAQGDRDQGDKSDQGGKSDQGAKSDNAKGQNAAPTQSQVRNAPSTATHNTMKSKRTRNAAANFHTRNTVAADRTSNTATTNHAPVAVAASPTSNTLTASRTADYSSMRKNVQASQHFHVAAYQQPQGYVSRHWGFGERLPSAYFARDYWLTDYLAYALFAPPEGLVWVRVGDDALLIDEDTGEIIQVDYGVFA